jgi:hypothetical protein
VELFKDRKTNLTLLSILSAAIAMSGVASGIPALATHAAVDDSNMNTSKDVTNSSIEHNAKSSDGKSTSHVDGTKGYHTGTVGESTSMANLKSLFEGLVVCDLGTSEIHRQMQHDAIHDGMFGTPTVSVKVVPWTDLVSPVSHEKQTSSDNNTKSSESAPCKKLGNGNTSTESKDASSVSDSSKTKSMSNTQPTSSDHKISSGTSSKDAMPNKQIAVIEGNDFAPGQVVLVYSNHALVTIDDVSRNGQIDAKVPLDKLGNEIRFVESGTNRVATFNFNGHTLISSGQGDIIAENSNANSMTAPNNK